MKNGCLLELENETGQVRQLEVEDEWLTRNQLEEGMELKEGEYNGRI